jgi:hypothetical protein
MNRFSGSELQGQIHIFYAGNDSDVTQSVFPEVAQFRAFEGLTNAAGIFEALQAIERVSVQPTLRQLG